MITLTDPVLVVAASTGRRPPKTWAVVDRMEGFRIVSRHQDYELAQAASKRLRGGARYALRPLDKSGKAIAR